MLSESHLINGLAGAQAIGYTYNLAGELKSLTDPHGRTVHYEYDATGRPLAVTGSGYNTSQFITNYQYRAWGAPKHFNTPALEYNTVGSVDFSYNTRLQLTHFEWVKPYSAGSLDVYKSNYQYYSDGRVKFISDVRAGANLQELYHNFDRGYRYDHVGRLATALTGDEARGGSTADGPYKETYQYDAWDHMTNRTNRIWSKPPDTYIANYINNRNHDPLSVWEYDADGNATRDDNGPSNYDASGRNIGYGSSRFYIPTGAFNTNPTWNPSVVTNTYDGDGQLVKQLEAIGQDHFDAYFVRSTALGGALILWIEVFSNTSITNSSDTLSFASVYAGGERIAQSRDGNVVFEFGEPFTGRRRDVEPDPLGQVVGTFDPGPEEPVDSGGYPEPHEFGNVENPGGGCTIDGITIDCNTGLRFVNSGGAYVCQNNNCSLRRTTVTIRDRTGHVTTYGGWIGPNALPDGLSHTWRGGAAFNASLAFRYATGAGFEGQLKAGIAAAILSSSLEYGGGFLGAASFSPQNRGRSTRLPLPTDLKARVMDIVNNPTTRCLEFIANLLAAAAIDGEPFSYNVSDLFDRVGNQAGFRLKKMENAGEANRRGNKRVIYVNPVPATGLENDPRGLNHTLNGYAATVLVELMHHAKASGLYSDRTLAKALFSLLTPQERIAYRLPRTDDIMTNSDYFHPLFNKKCFEAR